MTADGKTADRSGQAARFGSPQDRAHLERHIALADATLIGAGTLRAYGTSLAVHTPELLQERQDRGQSPQPIQILCSASGNLDPHWRFFQQPFPRWLITLTGQPPLPDPWWATPQSTAFDRIIQADPSSASPEYPRLDGHTLGRTLWEFGIQDLTVLGGSQLVATLLEQDGIDEFVLTLCPLLLGGTTAPTAIAGPGFLQEKGVPLQLEQCTPQGNEIFLKYRVLRSLQEPSQSNLKTPEKTPPV